VFAIPTDEWPDVSAVVVCYRFTNDEVAMAAGLTDHAWKAEAILALMDGETAVG
jgi:hypothetical protein